MYYVYETQQSKRFEEDPHYESESTFFSEPTLREFARGRTWESNSSGMRTETTMAASLPPFTTASATTRSPP